MNAKSHLAAGMVQSILTFMIVVSLILTPRMAVSAREGTSPPDPAAPEAEQSESLILEQATVEAPAVVESSQTLQLIPATVEIPPGMTAIPGEPEQAADPSDGSVEQTTGYEPETDIQDSTSNEATGMPVKVDEIIDTLAENDLAVVDENGIPLPLASEQAAGILVGADPYFTDGGVTYGWTNAGTSENPSCSSVVTEGHCTYSDNPINDAIASQLYSGQRLTIEDGDYTSNQVTIAKPVNLDPRVNLTVNSITLGNGAVINWSTSAGPQSYLTSLIVFVDPGAYLTDALELTAPGGTISLGSGTYDGDAGLDITKPVTISGAGASSTMITPISTCNRCERFFIINANDVKLRDFTLDGQYRVDTGIAIDNRVGLEVSNAVFKNIYRTGILVSDFSAASGGDSDTIATASYNIHNNLFQNILAGGATNEGYGIRIIDNAGPVSDHMIANNIFTQTNRAVMIKDSSVNIAGNDFYSNRYGVFVEDLDTGNEVPILYNRFFGNTSRGVNYIPSSSNDPVINADDNWWGCSSGAGGAGCDSSFSSRAYKISNSSYLKLGLTVFPTTIKVGETAAVDPFMYSSSDDSKSPIAGLSWLNSLVSVILTGSNYGLLDGNLFTADGLGLQNFLVTIDNGSAAAQVLIDGVTCQPGWNDADGNNTCEQTSCPAGSYDGNSDGLCEPIVCDDGDSQTENILNPDGTCSYPLKTCDDGDPQTENILNPDGTCSYPLKTCDDNDPQTENILNPDGTCSYPLKTCDDGNPQTDNILNPDGTCSYPLKTCDDGDPQTENILIPDGTCSHPLKTCDDNDPQTENILNPDGTCSYPLKTCDDNDPQTENILNPDGTCSHPLKTCDDNYPQTENILNPDGTCSYPLKTCEDNLPTTDNILNLDGTCSFILKSCDDQDPKTEDMLNADGTCTNTEKLCDDGLAFTENILNPDGTCSFPIIICDDGDPQTENILNPDGSCSYPLKTCNDGDPQTENILKTDGTCSYPLKTCEDNLPTTDNILNLDGTCSFILKSCDDQNPKTEDVLNEDGTCTNTEKLCDDGLAFTENILNPDGTCSFPIIVCDDNLPTTENLLNPDGTCSFPVKTCDDGLTTTENILNPDGTCSFPVKTCDDGLVTTENILNPDGTCSFPVKTCDDGLATTENILNPDGTCSFPTRICEDGDARTNNVLNSDGTCSYPLVSCDDQDPRTVDVLNLNGSCTNTTIICDDHIATTENILNEDGSCSYPEIVCDDHIATTENLLKNDGSCSYPEIVCDDLTATTENILNNDGSCSFQIKSCDDGQPGTTDILNPDGSCSHHNVVCNPGFNDADREGVCDRTNCPVGTKDGNNDGVCETVEQDNSGGFLDEIWQFLQGLGGIVPVTGGLTSLDGAHPAVLTVSGGGSARFSDPLPGFQAGLVPETLKSLPYALPEGLSFGQGLTLTLFRDNNSFQVLPEPVTYTLTFTIPPELQGKKLFLYFWDPNMNDSSGGWIELPLWVHDTDDEADLKPILPGDGRRLTSWQDVEGLLFEIELNFTGTFILVGK
ncbi:MAG: hypothetical protein AB9891_21890 [Anaerolineaceae bacterium]